MIQIGIACGHNCEYYVKFLIESIRKTAFNLKNIEFIFGINKESVHPDIFIDQIGFNYKIIKSYCDNGATSLNHGKCLNLIFSLMDAEYGMILDCDTCMLFKSWDVLFEKLIKENIVIVGTEYDGAKLLKFPNIVCCFFLTKILKDLNISYEPSSEIIINKYNKDIYNRNIGDKIFLDVGWEMCYKLKTNGYDGIHFPLVRTCSGNGKVCGNLAPKFMLEGMRGEEYQYEDTPIVTHIGRSSIRDFYNDKIVAKWREEVEKWINH